MEKVFNKKDFKEFKDSVVNITKEIMYNIKEANMLMKLTVTINKANAFVTECNKNGLLAVDLDESNTDSIYNFFDFVSVLFQADAIAFSKIEHPTLEDIMYYYHIINCSGIIYNHKNNATDKQLFYKYNVTPFNMIDDEDLSALKILCTTYNKILGLTAYINDKSGYYDDSDLLYDKYKAIIRRF